MEANRYNLTVYRVFAAGGDYSGFVLQPGPGAPSRVQRTMMSSTACAAALLPRLNPELRRGSLP